MARKGKALVRRNCMIGLAAYEVTTWDHNPRTYMYSLCMRPIPSHGVPESLPIFEVVRFVPNED
jgi:hypothetical protein